MTHTVRVRLQASLAGSIGEPYTERRCYDIQTDEELTINEAQKRARERAYAEGLEHVLINSAGRLQLSPGKPKAPTAQGSHDR